MSHRRVFTVALSTLTFAVACLPAAAQISSLNPSAMALNGSATATTVNNSPALSLAQDGNGYVAGSGWATTPQSVGSGFTTVFQFQLTHNPANGSGPADGFAFVLQNSQNFGQSGATLALGGVGGDLGYGAIPGDGSTAIDNSIAIEFDTYQNTWDPDADHIAVQSCGTGNNTPDHTATCQSGSAALLGLASMPNGITLADGNVHNVILQYDPGTLSIYIDNNGAPVLTVPLQIGTLLNLAAGPNNTQTAYVGFTGATGFYTEESDILSWTFTPGGTSGIQTTITQTLIPGPGTNTTNYVFGSYNHKYQYTNANPGDQVSVTAMPLPPSSVNPVIASYSPTASCITYQGTGGQCVVFHVTCTEATGADCTTLPYTLFESYNTGQTINMPCLLKTEAYNQPPTPTLWTNIETAFSQTRFDPTSTGRSNGFSYFVAAQNCVPVLPASSLNGKNCNGTYTGTYSGNLVVSPGQACIFTDGGITGSLLELGGSVTLMTDSFVNGSIAVATGTLSMSNSSVGGSVALGGTGTFTLAPSVTIGGDLDIANVLANPGITDLVCGDKIHGSVNVAYSAAALQIGGPTGCAGSSIGGNLVVQNDTALTQLYSNTVGGNLTAQNDKAMTQIYTNTVKANVTVQGNTGGSQVFQNVITATLACSGNTAITGGSNTAKKKTGQCAAF